MHLPVHSPGRLPGADIIEVMRRLGALAVAALAVLALAVSALVTPARAAPVTTPIMITGHDLHDGTIVQDGGTYYLYGTMYKCGFEWGHKNTPFCGFGVETASSLTGPWKYRGMLFSPKALDNWGPDKGKTWDWVCGSTGAGCFNPRMLHRPDGVWLLWFNAPRDHTVHDVAAYYVMGCNGPAGPCGYQAGAPHGSTHKPDLKQCNVNGDFSIITSGASAAILCSQYTLHEQALDKWWTDGTSQGGTGLAGGNIPAVSPHAKAVIGEGIGAWQKADGTWEMVYSTPGCGYCTGPPRDKSAGGATQVQAGYSTAPSMLGPWTLGSLPGGVLSPAYCTGQPRTVLAAAGQAWEWIDQWTGSDNETAANIMLEPMSADPWSCAVQGGSTPHGHG